MSGPIPTDPKMSSSPNMQRESAPLPTAQLKGYNREHMMNLLSLCRPAQDFKLSIEAKRASLKFALFLPMVIAFLLWSILVTGFVVAAVAGSSIMPLYKAIIHAMAPSEALSWSWAGKSPSILCLWAFHRYTYLSVSCFVLPIFGSLLSLVLWLISTSRFLSWLEARESSIFMSRVLKQKKLRSECFVDEVLIPYIDLSNPSAGTCLWRSLCSFGYSPFTLVHANIFPWTTSFSRVDMSIFSPGEVLPFYYKVVSGGLGHVSVNEFPGSSFGFNPWWARTHDFGLSESDTVKTSQFSPSVRALGGAKPILSQVAVTTRSANLDKKWSWGVFPSRPISEAINYTFLGVNNASLAVCRVSQFVLSYPHVDGAPTRLPQLEEDSLLSEVAWLRAAAQDRRHEQLVSDLANWDYHGATPRSLISRAEDISPLLNGVTDATSIRNAQYALSSHRFMSTRGNRIVPGWEANDIIRSQTLLHFIANAQRRVEYTEIFVRLWLRYLTAAQLNAYNTTEQPNLTLTAHNRGVPLANLQWLNNITPAPPAGGAAVANPEGAMWTPQAISALLDGRSQFFDVAGMSEREIVELLSAVSPQPADYRLTINNTATPNIEYCTGTARFRFTRPVTEVFLHSGPNAISPATQAAVAAAVHEPPVAVDIASVIRQLVMVCGEPQQAEVALEIALSKIITYKSNDVAGHRNNVPNDRHIYADGDQELALPRSFTAMGYLSIFFTPSYIDENTAQALVATPRELVNHGVLFSHARAVSLNWAAYAGSFYGRIWQSPVGAEPNIRIREHVDSLRRVYGVDKINLWSTMHANAMAHQFGFAPSSVLRMTESGNVLPLWDDYVTPYLANPYLELWMVDFLPEHQALPFNDDISPSGVSFGEDGHTPVQPPTGFNGSVQLFRSMKPFAGFAWINDGGVTANAQHYVAQPDAQGLYRYENGMFSPALSRHNALLPYEAPAAPLIQPIVRMAGNGSLFSDFALPGSVLNYNIQNANQHVFRIRMEAGAQLPRDARLHWTRLTQGESRQSLMINYVHPVKDIRAIDEMADYSSLIMERDNVFSGIAVVRHDLPNYEVSPAWDLHRPLLGHNPFSSAGATPDPFTVTRDAKRITTTTSGTRVASGKPRFRANIAVVGRKPAVSQMGYEAKVPNLASEMPHLGDVNITLTPEGISAKPSDKPTSTVQDAYMRDLADKAARWDALQAEQASQSAALYTQIQRQEAESDAAEAQLISSQAEQLRRFREQRATKTQPTAYSNARPRSPTPKHIPDFNRKYVPPVHKSARHIQFGSNAPTSLPPRPEHLIDPEPSDFNTSHEGMPLSNKTQADTSAKIFYEVGLPTSHTVMGSLPNYKGNESSFTKVVPNDSAAPQTQTNAFRAAAEDAEDQAVWTGPPQGRWAKHSNKGPNLNVSFAQNASNKDNLTPQVGSTVHAVMSGANGPKN